MRIGLRLLSKNWQKTCHKWEIKGDLMPLEQAYEQFTAMANT